MRIRESGFGLSVLGAEAHMSANILALPPLTLRKTKISPLVQVGGETKAMPFFTA